MFELIVRVLLASGAMAASGFYGAPGFDLTWRASLFFTAYSYLLYVMGQKGVRNSGAAGLAAVADCGIIAAFMADAGALSSYGFVCAAPMVIAFLREKANAAMMAPLVASWLLVGANLFGGGNAFTSALLVQSLAILLVGLVMGAVRNWIEGRPRKAEELDQLSETLEVLRSHIGHERNADEEPAIEQEPGVDVQGYIEFRENFRALTDSARDLERRSRRDRDCVHIVEAALGATDCPIAALAGAIQEASGAEGVGLYTVSTSGDALIARSAAGRVEQAVTGVSIEFPRRAQDVEIKSHAEGAIRSLRDPNGAAKFSSVMLKVKGRLVGMVTLFHSSGIELEASVRRVQEAADFVAEVVADQLAREEDRRKMHEAELLYTIAATSSGATDAKALVSRVCRDLFGALRIDHLSFWFVEGGKGELQCTEGVETDIFEEVAFSQGKGVEGWIKSGCPVTAIPNARDDARIAAHAATKRRIGSLLIVPLEFGAEPFGYVVATTARSGGIDAGVVETVRAVCAETSLAIARAEGEGRGPEGLATPKEFFEIVRGAGSGHLVYLEVPQREQLAEIYGRPALDHAVRRFAVRLRAELPSGGAVCRRNEGDYVAYIPSDDGAYVGSWANDAAALASMIGVRTPDGRTRIPLALRARIAPVNQQIHRISTGSAA